MAGNTASYCSQGEREDRNGSMKERAREQERVVVGRGWGGGRVMGVKGGLDRGPRRAPFRHRVT